MEEPPARMQRSVGAEWLGPASAEPDGDLRFRHIVERSVDGAVVVERSIDGTILYANPAAADLLGLEVSDLIGRPFGRPIVAGQTAEVDIPTTDGRSRVAELRTSEVHWAGRPAVLVNLREVTAYRQLADDQRFLALAGSALVQSLDLPETLHRTSQLVIEHLCDACLIDLIQTDGTIVRATARHAEPHLDRMMAELRGVGTVDPDGDSGLPEVLGTGRLLLRGQVDELLLNSLDHDPNRRETIRSLGVRSVLALPLVARSRTLGALTLLTTRAGRVLSTADVPAAQELARVAALALDNARLYDEAREAVRRRDEFLAMLSHELRNPMASIVHAVALLRAGESAGPDAASHATEVIERQADLMTRLLDDLLDISRVTRGVIRLNPAPIDLREIIDRAIQAAAPVLESRGHRFHRDLPQAPVPLEADSARLVQVFLNLLTNAAKYTPTGGNVWLSVTEQEPEIEVRVRDDGLGIEPELLPRVFDLFVQGRRGLDRSSGGLGIGLTLVARLVHLHGGSITAQSDGPGQGSTFIVRLPRAAHALDRVSEQVGPDEHREKTRPAHVMIVEDDDDIRELLQQLLKLMGHQVVIAADGPSALEAIRRHTPDIALIDLGLPGIDGLELARLVRSDPTIGDLRMIALSGYARPEDHRRSREAGFDAHLAKPVQLDVLCQYLDPDTPRQSS